MRYGRFKYPKPNGRAKLLRDDRPCSQETRDQAIIGAMSYLLFIYLSSRRPRDAFESLEGHFQATTRS